ncbi:MAG: HD domain-containing phosphohydrolase [Planctomycetota bacterium]
MIDSDTLRGLLTAIELKDAATAAHTWRVTLYARTLAEAAGITGDRLRLLTVGAALHDIGKVDIDDAVLRKTDSLSDDEFEVMRRHPVLGYDRLVSMGVDDDEVLALVRSHHERWDGLGYPDGLKGEAIPLAARYLAVVDVFDAMTSIRPYRESVGEAAADRALEVIVAGAGSQHCAECVATFEQLYRRGGITWILHYYNDGKNVPSFEAMDHIDGAVRDLKPPSG